MHKKPLYPTKDSQLRLEECSKPIAPESFLRLYTLVGKDYQWTDRLVFSASELNKIINQPSTHIYLFKIAGKEFGFSELTVDGEHVEILFFGLFPDAIGKGWGKAFLQLIVEEAWSFEPKKVILNTCDWDHPRALGNYLQAGFKEVRRIVKNQ